MWKGDVHLEKFMDENFLLDTETAKKLFHEFCENMPICDYHCHLSPKEIYENESPADISELWLSGDHYKWRAMRSCGVDESYCTGDRSGREKFKKFTYTLQYAIGNPLYHWAHLELQRYFGIRTPISARTADEIYDRANAVIHNGDFRPQRIIQNSNVNIVCTTDDPADSLEYHSLLAKSGFGCPVLPGFRPDKALSIENAGFSDYIRTLADAAGIEIGSYKDVISALLNRIDYFHERGCRVSDHAFDYVPYSPAGDPGIEKAFQKAMNGGAVSRKERDAYKTAVMAALGEKYHELGWAMEIHIGAMRNNNTAMFKRLGPDTGFDSVGDENTAYTLGRFLDSLEVNGKLPKTVLFNLNSKDNIVLATMLGNFQSGETESKLQFGPAWWFLDTMDGMTAQLKTLANLGILGKFIGMETDSRSFTSYPRHEYFRRIMCRVIGRWVDDGWYANDEEMLKEIVCGISYNNAVQYFGF